jgi:hypothetical protein
MQNNSIVIEEEMRSNKEVRITNKEVRSKIPFPPLGG